jgi:KipI family sensor histidine kinase inhibitor
MIKNISNLGDAALYCDFGSKVNKEINSKVIQHFKNIKEKKIEGITNITPSYNKLIISFDMKITNFSNLKEKIENLDLKEFINEKNDLIKIPICCDKEFSLDLKRLEKKIKISEDKILEKFFSREYYCYMTGFIAGHPFLGDTDESLRAKRLETPRVKIPKGSVGLAEQFCNIYTFESPGGWNIIGNTPLNIFDKTNEVKPNLINPGDTVIFEKISKAQYEKYND